MNKIQANIEIINALAELDDLIADIIYMEVDKLKFSLANKSSLEDILAINSSIKTMLNSISNIEKISSCELCSAINHSKGKTKK